MWLSLKNGPKGESLPQAISPCSCLFNHTNLPIWPGEAWDRESLRSGREVDDVIRGSPMNTKAD